jgi:asparagine synthase (glutamine-hydrolysing)
LTSKIKTILGTGENRIDRQGIEMLYPYWRLKYWGGNNHRVNNQLAYALTPFTDARIVIQSFDIPLQYKQLGVFEAALIRSIDPHLARYRSAYGFSFSGDIRPLTRIIYFSKVYTPVSLRPFIRKHLWKKGDKRCLPFYLTKEYLARVFPSSELCVSEYACVDRITNPDLLSRILSVELLVTDRF